MISALGVWALGVLAGVQPLEEIRFTHVFEQRSDFSCGIASVSSLASIYWGIEASEERLTKLFFAENEDKHDLVPEVTMYDMKMLLERLGFIAAGFELSYADLYNAALDYGPLIVHLNIDKGHFALYLGEVSGFAVLGDPSCGCLTVAVGEFLASWSNTALAVFHPGRLLDGSAVARAADEAGGRLLRLLSWCRQ